MIPFVERLQSRIDVGDPDECWLWRGCINRGGYGVIRIGPRRSPLLYVHRVVYAMFVADIPEGMTVDHLCSDRACVNPDHLDLVSMPENSRRGCLRRWHGRTFWEG